MPAQTLTSAPIAGDGPGDEEIVQRISDGDRMLYELLMRRYNQRLYRIIRGILGRGGEAEAEDALQESYLHAFEHLDQFRGEAKFATWLTRVAVHEASRRRKCRRNTATLDDSVEPASYASAGSAAAAPEQQLENGELRQVLTESIDQLPEGLRSVLVLREIEGLDTHETAEFLGLSESNVRIQLHRARGLLQSDIDNRLGSEVRKLYQFGAERCDRVVQAVMRRIGSGEAK